MDQNTDDIRRRRVPERELDAMDRKILGVLVEDATISYADLGDRVGLENVVAGTISQYPDDQIVSFLALAGPRDQRVGEHIRGGLTADHVEVQLAAARAMGMLGSDEGYGIALQRAASRDPRQRALAAFAFGDIGRADAQTHLAPLLKDEDENVRLAAAVAVLKLREGQ